MLFMHFLLAAYIYSVIMKFTYKFNSKFIKGKYGYNFTF
jgi:hypothetical protein